MYLISYACKNALVNEALCLGEPEFAADFEEALQQAEERVIDSVSVDLSDNPKAAQELIEEVQGDFAEARNTGDGWSGAWSAGEDVLYEVAVSVTEVPESA